MFCASMFLRMCALIATFYRLGGVTPGIAVIVLNMDGLSKFDTNAL